MSQFPLPTKSSLILVTATLTLIFVFAFKPIVDTDFGWHLRTGQWILAHHRVPHTDLFSFSNPGYPYIYHSWLMEVFYALSYSIGDVWGVSFVLALLISIGYSFLLNLSQNYSYHPFYFLAIPATLFPLTTLTGSTARTQAASFFFLTLTYYLLEKSLKHSPSSSYLSWLLWSRAIFLPIIFLLWANSHGGFVLGVIFSLTFLIFHLFSHPLPYTRTQKTHFKYLSLTLLVSYLSTLINPYYYRLHIFAFQMFTNNDARLLNLDWMPHQYKGHPIAGLSFLLILILGLVVVKAPRLQIRHRLLLTYFLLLNLFLPRLSIVFFIVLIPLVPYALHHLSPTARIQRLAGPAYLLILIAFTISFGIKNFRHTIMANFSLYGQAEATRSYQLNFPISTLSYLNHHPPQANLLNNINWGGYIIYYLPHLPTFADGKMDNYYINGETFIQIYKRIVNTEAGWEGLLTQYQINSALLDSSDPLSSALKNHPDWKLVFEDDVSVLLTRNHPI